MPNYAETTAPGAVRRRAHRIEIDNPDGGVPAVMLYEQDRINLADGSREYVPRGALVAHFDADGLVEEFPLVDIATGAPLGPVMTGVQLMVAVQSWVLHQMMKRDAPAAPAEGGA